MTDMLFSDTYSLWALSCDGTLWQVNPISGIAAPLCALNELSPEDCEAIKREMQALWRGDIPAESSYCRQCGVIEEAPAPRYDIACV